MLEVYNNLREAWPDVHDSSCLCDFWLSKVYLHSRKCGQSKSLREH